VLETLDTLTEKIGRIEHDLAEVRRGLEELGQVAVRTPSGWPAAVRRFDKAEWKEWFDSWFCQMGLTAEPIGAERLQDLMARAGVRREDNLLSSGIIQMREE
jgi:hypothetical protein